MRDFPSQREILKVFEEYPGKTFRLGELIVELGLASSQARELRSALKDLSRHRRIVYLKKNHFALADKHARRPVEVPAVGRAGQAYTPGAEPRNLLTGRLIGHRD